MWKHKDEDNKKEKKRKRIVSASLNEIRENPACQWRNCWVYSYNLRVDISVFCRAAFNFDLKTTKINK